MQIERLQNLVQIKDARIQDLTHQIANLRTMYEAATNHISKSEPRIENFDPSGSEVNNNQKHDTTKKRQKKYFKNR